MKFDTSRFLIVLAFVLFLSTIASTQDIQKTHVDENLHRCYTSLLETSAPGEPQRYTSPKNRIICQRKRKYLPKIKYGLMQGSSTILAICIFKWPVSLGLIRRNLENYRITNKNHGNCLYQILLKKFTSRGSKKNDLMW